MIPTTSASCCLPLSLRAASRLASMNSQITSVASRTPARRNLLRPLGFRSLFQLAGFLRRSSRSSRVSCAGHPLPPHQGIDLGFERAHLRSVSGPSPAGPEIAFIAAHSESSTADLTLA